MKLKIQTFHLYLYNKTEFYSEQTAIYRLLFPTTTRFLRIYCSATFDLYTNLNHWCTGNETPLQFYATAFAHCHRKRLFPRINIQTQATKLSFSASRKLFSHIHKHKERLPRTFAAEINLFKAQKVFGKQPSPTWLCYVAMNTNSLNKTGIALALLLLFCTVIAEAQQSSASLSGRLYESNGIYSARAVMVQAQKDGVTYKIISDTAGRFTLRNLPPGVYRINILSQFYTASTRMVHLRKDEHVDIVIEKVATVLSEVYITASEARGMTSASVIDRKAMQHLQPSSFTDLLELLPGGRAKDPSLTIMNQVRLREVGITSASYDISSLGTAFIIDDAPINTSANLQSTAGYSLSSPNDSRNAVNKGVDMRMIATDQIEKVEITRGIPSVEYGDLTSGLIQITRKKGATPYTARIKSDGFSKLFSLGKGFYIPSKNITINVDFGYLDSKAEPRNNFETYQRINGSLRLEKTWNNSRRQLKWSTNLDYAANIDNERVDPDNGYAPVDKYVSRNNNYGLSTSLKSNSSRAGGGIKYWELTGGINYTHAPLDQTKWVQPKSAGILFNSTTAGDHDLLYMGGGYASQLRVDDQPFNAFFKAAAKLEFQTAAIKHEAKIGLETRYSKNLGDGQIYDLNYPPNPDGIPVRPRAFNSIPGMLNQAFYAEDMFTFYFGNHKLTTTAGIRAMSLLGMDRQYTIGNKPYIDPRINLRWQLPRTMVANRAMLITLGAGYGVHTKMPTLDQLYPADRYTDIVQLNFYHNNPAYRKANAVTYITDRRNFDIEAAINYKWELNGDIEWAGNRFSITYFKERMNTGFRNISRYQALSYKVYDTKSVDAADLTAPPQTSDFSYLTGRRYFTYSTPSNGSRLLKEGIEFQFTSKRIKGINTRFTLNGAWFNSTYTSSIDTYETLTGSQVADAYVGRYIGIFDGDNQDGYLRQQFNTNLTIDSYLPKLGLIISTSLQNIWFTSRQNAYAATLPTSYMDIDGNIFPYTKASQEDPNLRWLDRLISATYFNKTTVPIDLQGNIKVTKEFRKVAAISMFVNRLFTYTPNYTNNGVYIRRSGFSSPYFGMEINLKF